MSQKWKMCLVSERGQTRAWIFITCTATRWRRPIHQAELSRWSQTFPIKTPLPHHHHPLAASRSCSVKAGGPSAWEEREMRECERSKETCFAQLWTLRPAHRIPSLTASPWLHWLQHFSLISAFSLFLWTGPWPIFSITFINTAVTGRVDGQKGQDRKACSQAA